jgi:hypothetical protein
LAKDHLAAEFRALRSSVMTAGDLWFINTGNDEDQPVNRRL